jgi:hypothetical protein
LKWKIKEKNKETFLFLFTTYKERRKTNKRLFQVLEHFQRAGIQKNPEESLKLVNKPSNFEKNREIKKTIQKRWYCNIIDKLRLKPCQIVVNRGPWDSGGREKPRVSWKSGRFFFIKILQDDTKTRDVFWDPVYVRGICQVWMFMYTFWATNRSRTCLKIFKKRKDLDLKPNPSNLVNT